MGGGQWRNGWVQVCVVNPTQTAFLGGSLALHGGPVAANTATLAECGRKALGCGWLVMRVRQVASGRPRKSGCGRVFLLLAARHVQSRISCSFAGSMAAGRDGFSFGELTRRPFLLLPLLRHNKQESYTLADTLADALSDTRKCRAATAASLVLRAPSVDAQLRRSCSRSSSRRNPTTAPSTYPQPRHTPDDHHHNRLANPQSLEIHPIFCRIPHSSTRNRLPATNASSPGFLHLLSFFSL